MSSRKRALIAGGAGFIGSHLCEYLLNLGYEVHVADNLVTGRKENIAPLFDRGLIWFDMDVISLHPLNHDYDEIYNLASPASPVEFSRIPVFILKTAAIGHMQLLEMAKDNGCPILLASTSEVYGDPLVHPQREDYLGNVNPVGPRGCYDEAKRYAEALSMAYHRMYKVDTRIVRIFNTYGPRMRPEDGRIIPNFAMQAFRREPLTVFGDGRQTRSFCYVSDMVAGLYALMQSSEHMPVNIGNPVERSVLEMADEINRLTGNTKAHKFLPLPQDDPKQRCPDISRARQILKWEPKVSLAQGLEKTLAYFREQASST